MTTITAWQIWRKSFKMAVVLPASFWLVLMALWSIQFGIVAFFYSAFIHSLLYALIGVPLFSKLLKESKTSAWKKSNASGIGAMIAAGGGFFVFTAIGNADDGLQAALILGVYGAWTGLAASCAKRQLEGGMS